MKLGEGPYLSETEQRCLIAKFEREVPLTRGQKCQAGCGTRVKMDAPVNDEGKVIVGDLELLYKGRRNEVFERTRDCRWLNPASLLGELGG